MAAISAQDALERVFTAELSGGGYSVHPEIAPASARMPFIVFNVAAGGEDNVRGDRQDASFVVAVRCIAVSATEASAGQAYIAQKLNDRGEQGRYPLANSNTDWVITTITQNDNISLTIPYEGAAWEYTRGAQYLVVMEERKI